MISFINNMSAMNANRMFGMVCRGDSKSIEKLSSGYRINRAADDASGLAISEKMRKQIRGLSMGVRNSQDAVSLCQVADGALAEVHDMINRINELSIKAANGTMSSSDRMATQEEVSQLTIEISRIGANTTFNETHIFAYGSGVKKRQQIDTSLIKSPSAPIGYLSEIYKYGDRYFPAASMDFSDLKDSVTLGKLDGKSFSFTCSQSCPEAFVFTFVRKDGKQNYFLNPESKDQKVPHEYQVDLQGASDGSELLDILFKLVKDNPARSGDGPEPDSLLVSHSNVLVKAGSDRLILRATVGYNTEEAAQNKCDQFAAAQGRYGVADFAGVAKESAERVTNVLSIHYGADAKDRQEFYIEEMNAKTLGLMGIKVTTVEDCYKTIDKVAEALVSINRQRASIGAQQNRFEHTILNEDNVVENLTASESRIRDTDMSKEIVKHSLLNVLQQSGQSMLAQANQSNQGVLALVS